MEELLDLGAVVGLVALAEDLGHTLLDLGERERGGEGVEGLLILAVIGLYHSNSLMNVGQPPPCVRRAALVLFALVGA